MKQFLFLELLKRYINTLPTLTQLPTGEDDDEHTNRIKLRRRNKFFEELKEWTEDAIQIKTWREFFEKSIPRCLAILLKLKGILMLTPQ